MHLIFSLILQNNLKENFKENIRQLKLKVDKIKWQSIFAFALAMSIQVAQAQPFAEAPDLPKQNVKEIIEWIRLDFEQKSKEGAVCNFDKKGNLVAYYEKQNLPHKKLACKFDKKNRIIEKTEWFDTDQMTTYYAYKKNLKVEEVKFRGKTYKTFYYKNGKQQLVEKKTYTKGLELGNDFLLKERILYHYNKKDSLTGEKIFRYDLLTNGKSKKYETRKIVHHYNEKTRTRSKSLDFDFDGSLISEKFYEYDGRNRLIKTTSHFKIENSITTTDIKYKNGKVWQSTTERPGYKDVKIYVDGRLIRLRSYNEEKIIRIVDYQYVYY